ncbi:MAG: amidohydrolase family protein [Sphingobacteriales bacterium]|nr:MAG: amidohydrolase family protein [Sphingobacteriales bacterium]
MRLLLVFLCIILPTIMRAQNQILINNVIIFNGQEEKTFKGNVLIEGEMISKISASPIITNKSANVTIIDGKGKFLMPGLIDAHVHVMMESMSLQLAMASEIGYINLVAADAARKQLLRGFTTVRDLGGASLNLKKAIDQGLAEGPRIYPSGAIISQTGGHGDFGLPTDVPRDPSAPLSYMERAGMASIADGADEVLKRSREQLRQGACQLKLMAGGGVSSNYDPLDVAQYSEDEFKAAVLAAENWGTYVTVHAYTPRAIQTAIKAGVKCIDHGQLMDETTAKLMADKKIWLSLQPFVEDGASAFAEGSPNRIKQKEMFSGTENAYMLAKKYKIKTAFGTDILFEPNNAVKQGQKLATLARWYSNFEILKMATADNAELLAMSGPRNPYPGKLGVIEEKAYADLILVDGNPLTDIKLVEDPGKNFLLIMKSGKIYKNTIK